MTKNNAVENWWENHPLFKKFYVPTVLTATFLSSLYDIFNGSRGK